MQVGDLVRLVGKHIHDVEIQGIIISLYDDRLEWNSIADVYWINGPSEGQVVSMNELNLEVVCK